MLYTPSVPGCLLQNIFYFVYFWLSGVEKRSRDKGGATKCILCESNCGPHYHFYSGAIFWGHYKKEIGSNKRGQRECSSCCLRVNSVHFRKKKQVLVNMFVLQQLEQFECFTLLFIHYTFPSEIWVILKFVWVVALISRTNSCNSILLHFI